MSTECRSCSHERSAHEHYRAGSDCAQCACSGYKRNWVSDALAMVTHQPSTAAAISSALTRPAKDRIHAA